MQASAFTVRATGPVPGYARFRDAVAEAQLGSWLAEWGRSPGSAPLLVDISGPDTRAAQLAAAAGYTVLRVIPPQAPGRPAPGAQAAREPGPVAAAGRLHVVTGDGFGLGFLADGFADGVIAEDRTLSRNLAAETLVSEVARVLKPGGKVLACVDSLTLGMAVLAEQHHWPHLVDLPHADVVLVPWPDGAITRCYGAEHLRELFTGAGFDVNWIRPRTTFSPQTVSYLLDRDPGSFTALISAELRSRPDDSAGGQLVISARLR